MNNIQTLNEFNAWRRGDDTIKQPDPTTIGNAIDYATQTLTRLEDWKNMSSAQMRLQCGELTAEQIRIVRSILNVIAPLSAAPVSALEYNAAEHESNYP
jgi:hypothetical protein